LGSFIEKVLLADNREKGVFSYTHLAETESVTQVALYACVSTDRQDHERQIRELEECVGEEYPDATVERFADIISGTDDEDGVEYYRLREAIADGEVDVVVVHELSRLQQSQLYWNKPKCRLSST